MVLRIIKFFSSTRCLKKTQPKFDQLHWKQYKVYSLQFVDGPNSDWVLGGGRPNSDLTRARERQNACKYWPFMGWFVLLESFWGIIYD